MSLGERIRNRRQKLGLTQIEIAHQLNMGRSNFGHIENGRVIPTSTDLDKIADILKTQVDYLLGRTDDPEKKYKKRSLGWILNLNEKGYLEEFKKNAHPLLLKHFEQSDSLKVIIESLNNLFKSLNQEHDMYTSDSEMDLQSMILYLEVLNDKLYLENNEIPPYLRDETSSISNENKEPVKSLAVRTILEDNNIVRIPLLKFIRNGTSNPSEFIGHMFIDPDLIWGNEGFALKVNNDDMIGDRIHKGDIVIIKKQTDIESHDIAVVSVYDQLATLKRVKREGDICMLIPSNPSQTPDLVPYENVHIFGKVVEARFWPK